MNEWLFSWRPLAIGTVLYLAMVGAYLLKDRPAMALVFLGYSIGNIGLIWDYMTHQ